AVGVGGVRLRRAAGCLRDRLVDHAPEEEPRRRRADPRQDGPRLRRSHAPAHRDEGSAPRVPLRHAGGQGGVLRRGRHRAGVPGHPGPARARPPVPAGSPPGAGRRELLDRDRSRQLPGRQGPALPRSPRGGRQGGGPGPRPGGRPPRASAGGAARAVAALRGRLPRRRQRRGVPGGPERLRRHRAQGRAPGAGRGPRPPRGALRARGRAALALALLVPLALAACGRKGPPVAPERRLPAAVQDLSASVVAEGVRLSWTLPKVRVDRTPLKELRRVEVYRRPETGEAAPPRPAVLTFGGLFGPPKELTGFERVANIVLAESPQAPQAETAGPQVRYSDAQGLTFGQRYAYVVVAVDPQGRPSPPSNRVGVAMAAAPKVPIGLTADAGDREVRLGWTPPETLEDGSPAAGRPAYNGFRGHPP